MNNIGIDIIKISRIENAINKFGSRFLKRVFSEREINYCTKKRAKYHSFAGKFAAKEAFIKFNCGLQGIKIKNIEIINTDGGIPRIYINKKQTNLAVSISHSRDNAVAVVFGEKNVFSG